MILVRDVFRAKYGKGSELVEHLKEGQGMWSEYGGRILTDASGPFFTVVAETEVASLAAYEELTAAIFNHPEFSDWFARMVPLVESGSREFYNIEP